LIFLGVGALELGIGLFFYFRTRSFLERAVDTQGTVTGFVESHSSEGGTTYRPTVKYTTVEGLEQEFTERMGTSPPGFDVGESVKVKYDPKDAGKARIDKASRLWFVPVLLCSSGALFLLIGGFLAAAGV
jgi:hypothetical protein